MEIIKTYSDSESKKLDEYTIHQFGIEGKTLMGLASVSIFQEYSSLWKDYEIIILCGSGNNGGDGLALGYFLFQSGFEIKIFRKSGQHSEEYTFYLRLLQKSNCEISNLDEASDYILSCKYGTFLIVDAMLGIGFKPPLNDYYTNLVNTINTFRKMNPNSRILSIDCASGFFPCSNIHYIKPDFLAEVGVVKTNSIYYRYELSHYSFHPIGFPVKEFENLNSEIGGHSCFVPSSWGEIQKITKRESDSHKYTNGSATFIGGSNGMSGAIMISQNAFHVLGGGISKVFTPSRTTLEILLKTDPSMMATDLNKDTVADSFLRKSDVIVIGPGLNPIDLNFPLSYRKEQFVIIDAGSLESVKNKKLNQNFLLTPHIGEFTKLIDAKHKHIFDYIPYLKNYCIQNQVNVLLKSHISIFGDTTGKVYYWAYPNPRLAVMGSGDLLVGILAFFISRTKDWITSVNYSLSVLKQTENMEALYPTVNDIKNYIKELIAYA
ncbi:MAG: bifunctional ADP-dependent NAD(P)H-hydrate dehydratase/NAD(P)H-hydrate epimerase [Leptospiraceae bacterium]|nr:bifunctional ADP-dependent NAD(P)H-hydrate dehydratase/NAD(P)H-hydrate epimerase [Leptospiraceae bacterium]MCP5494207.1 bifunctional ADP-dependent NAD(P)H-hydrate dehydratase/NAD(P)H-hydrate epimerase [Leptospiraceae bacterium]